MFPETKSREKEKENWQDPAVFFPPFVTPLSTMLWSRAVMYGPSGVHCLMYHDRDTFDFSQGHLTKNQPMALPVQLSETPEI